MDTAMAYGNQREIGRAVRDSGVPRDRIWITSKILPSLIKRDDAFADVGRAVDGIIKELNAGGDDDGYLDLCLIHTPVLGRTFTMDAWRVFTN